MKKYTEEYLIESLKQLSIKLKRSPTSNDLGKKNSMPDRSVFENMFGSWNNALIEAELKINCYFRNWTKDKLLQKLREKAGELGRCPTQRDLDKDVSMPAKGNYRKYFGSF